MKKPIAVGLAIFSLLTFYSGSLYAADNVLFSWTVYIKNQTGSDEYAANMTLGAVKITLMAEAGLSPSLKNEYGIYEVTGPMDPPRLLNEDLTLEEEGITDGKRLIIKPY
jgi:hypothetical protein